MSRYIDADKLKRDLIDNRCFYPVIVKKAIENAPTEDVVPRSEVERDFEKRLAEYQDREKCIYTYDGEIWDYCVQGPCPHHKVLEDVRQDVARKIFEEIEKNLVSIDDVDFNRFRCIGARTFAELKKKYTESCTDCGHFVGCEKANWIRGCEEHTERNK